MAIHPSKFDENGKVQKQKKVLSNPLEEAKYETLVGKPDSTLKEMVEVLRTEITSVNSKLENALIEQQRLRLLLKKHGISFLFLLCYFV